MAFAVTHAISTLLGWRCFHLGLAAALVTLAAAWDRRGTSDDRGTGEGWIVLVASTLFLSLMWLPNYRRSELNFDEGEWIAKANDLVGEPGFWLRHFYVGNWARVLTILPLAALGTVAGPLGYADARFVGTLLWGAFTACHYVAAREAFGRRAAIWSATLLALIVGLFSLFDFVAYNSELPAIALCMGAFALAVRCLAGAGGVGAAFGAGFLVAAVPFAKDQGLPIAAVLGCGTLALFMLDRRRPLAVALVLGGLTCWLLLPLVLLATGNVEQWLLMTRIQRDYWAHGTKLAKKGVGWQVAIGVDMIQAPDVKLLLCGTLVACPFLVSAWRSGMWRPERLGMTVCVWAIVLWAAAAFAVMFPAQHFFHYVLLLVFPSAILLGAILAAVIEAFHPTPRQLAWSFLILLLFPLAPPNWHAGAKELARDAGRVRENLLTPRIRALAKPGDRLLLWGWRNSYFVETRLLLGARFMYPQFAIGDYPTARDVIGSYAEDIERFRPAFILEWVGDDSPYFTGDLAVRIDAVPELAPLVAAHYELVAQEGNQRLFRRTAGSAAAAGE